MKAPAWMELKADRIHLVDHGPDCDSAPHVHMRLRVRRWHPGYWMFVLRALWGARPR